MLTKSTVSIRGRDQVVFRGGSGDPLVWLHAADGVDASHPLIALLEKRFSVIAPLAPGFNDLAELDDIGDIHELAMHYDDLFETLGLDGATVVGHSFGGMVAAELAAHYPRRVAKLVLIAPVGLWRDEEPVLDVFAVPPWELTDVLYSDPSAAPAAGGNGEADIEALVALAQGMTSVAKFLWPIPDKGLRRRLERITASTLVLFGADDKVIPPSYADDFAAGLSNATKEIVSGAGHMVPAEKPDEIEKAIVRFLE